LEAQSASFRTSVRECSEPSDPPIDRIESKKGNSKDGRAAKRERYTLECIYKVVGAYIYILVAGIKRLLSRTHAYIHKQSERAYGDQPASEASSNALFKHTTLLLCLLETK